MATKATHAGTCQVCGSRQLLPGSVLAKHGYTTAWGFFSGVCSGSGHLPFERSKDLIEKAIADALHQAIEFRKTAAARRTMTEPAAVIYNAYANWSGRRFKSSCRRVPAVVSSDAKGFVTVSYTGPDGKPEVSGYGMHGYAVGDTITRKVAELNEAEAVALERQAKQAETYAEWQRARIKDWKPGAITPRGK